MVGLGMWACQWRELKPMAFGGKGKAVANGRPKEEEDGEGYAMGRGGRGRDGGAYEMVGMAPAKEPV